MACCLEMAVPGWYQLSGAFGAWSLLWLECLADVAGGLLLKMLKRMGNRGQWQIGGWSLLPIAYLKGICPVQVVEGSP